MAKLTGKLLALTLVGATGYGAYHFMVDDDGEQAQSTKHLVNQVWVNRLPQSERDMIDYLLLVDSSHGRLGAVGRASQWRQFTELFHWGLEGHRLMLFFPQDERKGKVRVRTWKCRGEAPEPFELCLEISAGQRSMLYYSMKDWVIDPDATTDALADLEEAEPRLDGVFDVQLDPSDFERFDPAAAERYQSVENPL